MSYLGLGVSPGNVPVYHGSDLKVVDRRVRLAELTLRVVVCGLALLAALLLGTDTQVHEIFTIRKKAKFTDMKALVILVVVNGITAAYSLVQTFRCLVSMAMAYVLVAAVGAATQSAAFAKFGEAELEWMKVCDMYGKFCNQIGEGIASSVFVCASMLIVSAISAFSLFRLYGARNKAW